MFFKKILCNFIRILFYLSQRFEKLTELSNCNEVIVIYFMFFFQSSLKLLKLASIYQTDQNVFKFSFFHTSPFKETNFFTFFLQ